MSDCSILTYKCQSQPGDVLALHIESEAIWVEVRIGGEPYEVKISWRDIGRLRRDLARAEKEFAP